MSRIYKKDATVQDINRLQNEIDAINLLTQDIAVLEQDVSDIKQEQIVQNNLLDQIVYTDIPNIQLDLGNVAIDINNIQLEQTTQNNTLSNHEIRITDLESENPEQL